jgi:ABC-type antimicrobial peptide transport system permease subunit
VLWGSIAGLAAAYAGADLMKSLLFGVAPLDPATYAAAAGALALVGAIACAAPALRAVRVDPLRALRNE